MFSNDSLDGIKAEAGSFTYTLRCKKRFEDMRQRLLRYPRAVVNNLDDGAIVFAVGSDL
jgi:hypothetical protein